MPEAIDYEQAVAALSTQERELLANRLRSLLGEDSDAGEHERLLAYLVPKPNKRPSVADLRGFVREQLPDYMVPADFIVLEEWPKTPGGKIDLQALSRQPTLPAQSRTATSPQNTLEQVIAALWREVLCVEDIGRDDNFFDLGGHSLLLMKVNLRLKHHCRHDIPLVEMFNHPTISSLAEFLSGHRNGYSPNLLQKTQERAAVRRETSQQQRARRQEYRSGRGTEEQV